MHTQTRQTDVCIVGAGVAGGILASVLGAKGWKVAVIEKNLAETERIVGELLQPGGVEVLQRLGLEHLLKGFEAQPVTGYALFLEDKHFPVSYPNAGSHAAKGFGFRNHKFISEIRSYLSYIPDVTLINGTVKSLVEDNGRVKGVVYESKVSGGEETILAPLTVVCDGMFSVFRNELANTEKKVSSYFMGMLLKEVTLPYPAHGHVILAEPSPCLLYPVSDSETRILIDFPQEEAPRKSAELTAYLRDTIAPQLPESVRSAFLHEVELNRFKVMPNHYIPAKPIRKPGAVLLGDSLNMRHPLTGGGMTVALSDIELLSNLLHARVNPETCDEESIDKVMATFYNNRHRQDATINILADALYGVMKNPELKRACFDYLNRGGLYAQEPVSLLSAISRDEDLLLRHFFAVAFYGIKNVIKTPAPKRFTRSKQMLTDAVDIVSPLVLNENPGLLTKYVFKASRAVFAN